MNDDRITAYLLQELTPEEAERFEEQCFAAEEWPAELEAAEQDLIDAYVLAELSKDRRQRFEEKYLTTDVRKARVLTARSFLQTVNPTPSPKVTLKERLYALWQRPLVPQFAVALLVLAVTIPLVLPLFKDSPQTFSRVDLAIASPDRAGGGPNQKIVLPLNSDGLRVYLKLPEPSPDGARYRVQWGNEKNDLGDLKVESQERDFVIVVIPTDKISPGKYALKIFRIDPDNSEHRIAGSYFFDAETR